MREIKFRAWVSEDDENFFMCRTITGYDSHHHLVSSEGYNYYNFELMQYTGLKDKNGVEIYEGDVLQDDYAEYYKVDWDLEFACFVFYHIGSEHFDNDLNANEAEQCKIIGNIYENPELIK